MEDKRTELIQNAILDKLVGVGLTIYTADEILLAAGVSEEEVAKISAKLKEDAHTLAKQNKPPKTGEVK